MTKYEFTDAPKPEQPVDPVELLATQHKTLIEAGRTIDVLSLKTGTLHPILQEAAQGQAAYQAELGEMGHQRWASRSELLFKLLPEYTGFREVCAYSGYRFPQVAKNLFESWWKSKAHWVWVNGHCDIWGYAMFQNEQNKLWYATGIFADRRK